MELVSLEFVTLETEKLFERIIISRLSLSKLWQNCPTLLPRTTFLLDTEPFNVLLFPGVLARSIGINFLGGFAGVNLLVARGMQLALALLSDTLYRLESGRP